jgi:hypothetical protein
MLMIIFLGTVQYFTVSRWEIEKGARSQMAWISMSSRLEHALSLGYDALQDSLPETQVPITLNGIQGYRTTVVTPVDDPLDGVAPTDTTVPDYKKVSIYFAWFTPENITDSVSVYFTPQRSRSY